MYRVDKTSNSVFSLCYHFIAVVKYRKSVFTDDRVISDLKTIVNKISVMNLWTDYRLSLFRIFKVTNKKWIKIITFYVLKYKILCCRTCENMF